ncbi:hypothetical protein [uncultured Friedmanniella sp.]
MSSTPEPAVLIELGDVVDEDVPDRQVLRQLPEPFGPEVMTTASHNV